MSIKNLFGKSIKNYQSASANVESSTFINKEVVERDTYLPPIDFATASNFVKYGSAELYYSNSISRIHDDYPYDGSEAEKISFHQSSSYLDRWMFTNKYPKSTGYINLGTTGYNTSIVDGYGGTATPEYIRTWGGLHTASAGMSDSPIRSTFDKSTKYNAALNRTQNWRVNPSDGSTIEFWLKKDAFNLANTEREVILDLWNGEASSSADYGRLTLELTGGSGATFIATLQSGTAGFYRQAVCDTTIDTASLTNWHHYAVSFTSASTGITTRFYIDGGENLSQTVGTPIGELNGLITGYIGALQTSPSGSAAAATAGKLSASVDEFRYWKTRRTSNDINLNWFTNVGGGSNTDDDTNNISLSVYYKFNEGIVGISSTDQKVLDYSGRIANGHWQGYTSTARNTGSAFTLSSNAFVEGGDPIIYSDHPEVSSLTSEMTTSGSNHDNEQGSSLFSSLPNWMQSEDELSGGNLKSITQILSSYFDTLHSQITALPNLKKKKYTEATEKALPFANRLLTDKGFITKDIFVNSEIVETFANKNTDSKFFSDNVNEIKNLIYTNIYNNLENIYKTKGTEKSIRNLIRCFGVDDEIIKLNVYTDGGTHYFTDKAKATSVKKKYINFDNPDYFSSTMYQTSSTNNALTFISGSTASANGSNNAFTLEADIVVPYKKEELDIGFYNTPFLSSSIFGFHEAIEGDPSDYTWATSTTASLSVYLVRDKLESKDARFIIKSQDGTINLTSSYISDIYNNNHWNLALRVKPDTYPYAGNVTNATPNYTIEFYGVNYNFDELANEIFLTASVSNASGSAFLSNPKRVYAGAHATNFTGSVLQRSDMQIGSVRAWFDYIGDASIQAHNKDPLNFGNLETYRGSNIFTIADKQISSQELTIFNWDFDTVSGSDGSGDFTIDDITSGSSDTIYGWIDNIIRREYRGKGDGFGTSTSTFIENEFLYAQRKELPEISYTNDNIFIKGEEQINFIKDDDVSDNFYMLEKSMNQVVSEEMLKLFSSVQEFANLIGRPVDRYRHNYKRLDKVRQHFFDKVEQDMDPEAFIRYYKWIDASISEMVNQLVPASVNFGTGVTDIVESHILERNKYQRRPGLLDTVQSTEASIRGIEELTYNWKTGHPSTDDNTNCLWQKERKERTDIPDRERIRKVLVNDNNDPAPVLSKPDKTIYQGSTYAIRRLSNPYKFSVDMNNSIHGGTNFSEQKNRDFFKSGITIHGDKGPSNAPRNVVGIGIGFEQGIIERQKCDDIQDPNSKSYFDATVQVGKFTDATSSLPVDASSSYDYLLKASMFWPFNIKSGSLVSGYNSRVSSLYKSDAIFVNIHSDTIDITNEIPIQGPFTQAHVGGAQNRHVNLNKYDSALATANNLDDQYTRPEAWRLLLGDNPLSPHLDGAMGFVGPDYGGPYPDTSRKLAIYNREEKAKRPVNIRNIETELNSPVHGNFQFQYEVFSTFGNQKYLLRREEGSLLPDSISNTLPQTTNYFTLVSQAPYNVGNVFGGGIYSNRQPDTGSLVFQSGTVAVSASGSFSVYGKDFIDSTDTLTVREGTYGTAGSGAPNIVATGSSDTDWYNNLSASVRANSGVTPTYTTSNLVYSQGIEVQARNASFMSASIGSSEIRTGDFAISFWLLMGSGSITMSNTIYRECNDAGAGASTAATDGRNVFINSAGKLRFMTAYNSGGGFVRDIFGYETFRADYFDQRIHVVWSHVATFNSSTAATLYINGVSSSIAAIPSGESVGLVQNTPTDVFFLNRRPTEDRTIYSGGNNSFIDEIVILNTTASQAAVDTLFNCGKRIDPSDLYAVIPSASITQYYGFEDNIINDEDVIPGRGSAPLSLDINNVSTNFKLASGSSGVCVSEPPQANFSLVATASGTSGNGPVSGSVVSSCGSYFNFTDLAGGQDFQPEVSSKANDIVREIPRSDLTSSRHVISTRFSAPGGPEVNSRGYLDIATGQYSVYNSLNYRNLSVRSSGSGEPTTIRVNSFANRREGLRTLRTRHCGQYGIESQYGAVSSTGYDVEPSFHKQHRNTLVTPRSSSSSVVDTEVFDNMNVASLLPRSDFQYSWINNAVSGSNWREDQILYGFAPTNGLLSSSVGINAAITFPTASTLFGV